MTLNYSLFKFLMVTNSNNPTNSVIAFVLLLSLVINSLSADKISKKTGVFKKWCLNIIEGTCCWAKKKKKKDQVVMQQVLWQNMRTTWGESKCTQQKNSICKQPMYRQLYYRHWHQGTKSTSEEWIK